MREMNVQDEAAGVGSRSSEIDPNSSRAILTVCVFFSFFWGRLLKGNLSLLFETLRTQHSQESADLSQSAVDSVWLITLGSTAHGDEGVSYLALFHSSFMNRRIHFWRQLNVTHLVSSLDVGSSDILALAARIIHSWQGAKCYPSVGKSFPVHGFDGFSLRNNRKVMILDKIHNQNMRHARMQNFGLIMFTVLEF